MKLSNEECGKDESHEPRYVEGTGLVRTILLGTARLGFKAVAYPVVGNLSTYFQEGLENLVGKDWFDGATATQVSRFTNLVTYPAVFFWSFDDYSKSSFEKISAYHLTYGPLVAIFGFLRDKLVRTYDEKRLRRGCYNGEYFPEGTILGEIFSRPFKNAYIAYKQMKEEFTGGAKEQNTHERAAVEADKPLPLEGGMKK